MRGLAALSVLLFHYCTRFDELYHYHQRPLVGWSLGSFGMQFFFMISGFLIFMTLERTQRKLDFVVSRVSRLYPVYWAAIAVTTAVVWTFGLPGMEVGVKDTLASATMIQSTLGFKSVDGVYWSLLVELKFYVAMFLVFACGMLPRMRLLMLAWVPLAFIVNHVYQFSPYGHAIAVKALHGLLISDWIHLFALGIVMYHRKVSGRFTFADLALIGLCLANEYQHHLLHMGDPVEGVRVDSLVSPGGSALIVAGLCGVFYLMAAGWLKWLHTRPLLFLGAISYPLYLVHQNIGFVVLRGTEQAAVNVNLGILIATIVAIVVAAALHYSVEMPAMKAIRSRYKARRRAPRSAGVLSPDTRLPSGV
jgi:peptidoglycan/LPS O-acetylase OafA/YrhL